jgi:plasmid stabilization system protein ParE
MKYVIIFSYEAIETFESIKEQIRERWDNKTMVEFEKRTRQVLSIIETLPFIFKSISLNNNIRRGFIHRNCSMFYEVNETQIDVLFFWDNRQDPIF